MPGDVRRHHGCTHRRGSGRAGRPAYGPLERRYGDAPIRLTGASRHVATLDHHSERLAAKGFMSEMTFPEQRAESGRDMSVKPEIWGKEARLRFSNALGTRPVTFAPEPAGLHRHGNGDRPQPDAAPGR